jgi:hypothetical protein
VWFTYNTTELEKTVVHQTGGVCIITTDDVNHRVIQHGCDPLDLGRWSWVLLEGRQHHRTRTVTAYRPCDSTGPATVCQQHQRHYHCLHRDVLPRQARLDDLYQEAQGWLAQGDHLGITMDANDILSKHPTKFPPATQNRNTSRQPIDGIWTTAGLKAVSAGYLPFGEVCPSDHRALWIDVEFDDVFGYKGYPYIPATIR